jgi:phosphatidylserine synthase 2
LQNRDEARFALSYLYPDLGVKPVERSYADACEFTWANIKPAMFDIFFLSHFLGWVCKSIMMRDLLFCWTLSIGWELIELAFVFMLPNFNECWWDQWILDVLLTNGLGIYVGHRIAQHLEVCVLCCVIICHLLCVLSSPHPMCHTNLWLALALVRDF